MVLRVSLRSGCKGVKNKQSAMAVYQKRVFPIVEISICGPQVTTFNLVKSSVSFSLFYALKVQTLRALCKRAMEIVQRCKCMRRHIKAIFLLWKQIYNCFLISNHMVNCKLTPPDDIKVSEIE